MNKVDKLYRRFIGPNSIGMSKNLENGIRKALHIAVIQSSKKQERRILEAVREKVCEKCEIVVETLQNNGILREENHV